MQIQAGENTPQVELNGETGTFVFGGNSMPNDVTLFYKPILEWLNNYKKNPKQNTKVIFDFTYFSMASSKLILDIMLKLDEYQAREITNVQIDWYYPEDDPDMLEAGEQYADIVDLSFRLISKKNQAKIVA